MKLTKTTVIMIMATLVLSLNHNIKTISAAPPYYLNYQGRLKYQNKPVSDYRFFEFKITNSDGSQVYWTSGSTRVWVSNGLFRYVLGPLNTVNWANIEPYLEVKVGIDSPSSTLLPREKLVSSLYAIFSASSSYSYETLNANFLSGRPYEAFVSTRSTDNQTIEGQKTFTGNIFFQSNIAIGTTTISSSIPLKIFQKNVTYSAVENICPHSGWGAGYILKNDVNEDINLSIGGSTTGGAPYGPFGLIGNNSGRLIYSGSSLMGIGTYTNTPLYLGTNNTYRVVIASTGFVGVGTEQASSPLHIGTNQTGNLKLLQIGEPGYVNTYGLVLRGDNSTGIYRLYALNNSVEISTPLITINRTNGFVGIGADNPGDPLAIGGNRPSSFLVYCRNYANTTTANGIAIVAGDNGGGTTAQFMAFQHPGGTLCGSITKSGTNSVAYNTTSDRRLKRNISPSKYGVKQLMDIKVVDYTWYDDISGAKHTGIIAQELYPIYPEAVYKPMDDKKDYWAVDYGKLTPLLVIAIQELKKENEELKNQIDVLKCHINKLSIRKNE